MPVAFANNASSTLSASITSSQTTLAVASGQGSRFPTLSGSDYFYSTLVDVSNNIEIVKVTARAIDTFTIVRAQEGTTARAYASGSIVELRLTAAALNSKMDKAGGAFEGSISTPNGITAGSPTGGDMGDGTINASSIYVDGVPVGTGSGTVASVNASGGTTGLNFTGGPITGSGTLLLAGTLGIANGGTGGGTAAAARTALGLGTVATKNSINLVTDVTGTLAVASGGTGVTSLASILSAINGQPKITVVTATSTSIVLSMVLSDAHTWYLQMGTGSLSANSIGSITYPQPLTTRARGMCVGGGSNISKEGDIHNYAVGITSMSITNTSDISGSYEWWVLGY